MKSNDLVNNSIRKQLSEQRNKLSTLENQVDELNADIETQKLIIGGLESGLGQNSIVTSDDDSKFGLDLPNTTFQSDNLPNISKKCTLTILKNSDRALHGNEIAEIYKQKGIVNGNVSTHGKIVRAHLRELEKEGLIYLTNPGAQRSMRYASARNKEE